MVLALFLMGGCAPQRVFTPPKYQEPTLPPWEASPAEADPLDATLTQGEWVEEPSVESEEPTNDGTHPETEPAPAQTSPATDPPRSLPGRDGDPSQVESPQ
jgi:hypothetical protein